MFLMNKGKKTFAILGVRHRFLIFCFRFWDAFLGVHSLGGLIFWDFSEARSVYEQAHLLTFLKNMYFSSFFCPLTRIMPDDASPEFNRR